jgi:hypothetical protein
MDAGDLIDDEVASQSSYGELEFNVVASDHSSDSVSEVWETSAEEISHTCSGCPELVIDSTGLGGSESNAINATFGLSPDEMYTAVTQGCKFVMRLVDAAESLLKRTPAFPCKTHERITSNCVDIEDMGLSLKLDVQDFSRSRIIGQVKWATTNGSYAHPGT